MRFPNLHEWLAWQEKLHPSEIELGLDRVAAVLQRMNPGKPAFSVISVAGTNGKGSCVAMLDAIYRAAGYSVGAYTSPHLKNYNERISINGVTVSDQQLCDVFDEIDQCRKEISLTYFEFGTLAAIALMFEAQVDIAILEVGLGGRLDAVNIMDADVAVISSIGIDHQAWLGDDREKIALEKAGIARSGHPLVCGEPEAPSSLLAYTEEIGAPLYLINRDFFVERGPANLPAATWNWSNQEKKRGGLPLPALRGDFQLNNAAVVLQVIELLSHKHPVAQNDIRQGLNSVSVPARFQVIPGDIALIIDVAHNVQAAQALADNLAALPCSGSTIAVFACLNDKDLAGIVQQMAPVIDRWFVATLAGPRATPAEQIAECIAQHGQGSSVTICDSIVMAKDSAVDSASVGDRVVMFGSFFVASQVI